MIILKMTLAKGVRVHFCSKYERRFFKKIKNFNTFIFPPFFISEEKSKNYHKSDILFVGRDDEHKGLDEFVSFAIKIVLRSVDSANVPLVENFRAIALSN